MVTRRAAIKGIAAAGLALQAASATAAAAEEADAELIQDATDWLFIRRQVLPPLLAERVELLQRFDPGLVAWCPDPRGASAGALDAVYRGVGRQTLIDFEADYVACGLGELQRKIDAVLAIAAPFEARLLAGRPATLAGALAQAEALALYVGLRLAEQQGPAYAEEHCQPLREAIAAACALAE